MPKVYPCEQCREVINEDDDQFVEVKHVSGGSYSQPRMGRVHAKCWKEYQKQYPDSEPN